jgi:hypothetical protein
MSKPNYYLVSSSLFFLGPTLFGLCKGYSTLPIVTILSTASSIQYWINPSAKNKYIDLAISKMTGVIYFVYGYQNIQPFSYRLIGYTNLFFMVSAYNASCILHEQKNNDLWIPFHIVFHYLVSLGQFIVLSSC